MRSSHTLRMATAFEEDGIETTGEEPVDAPDDAGEQTTEADYSFEGYSVEFLDKVVMIAIASVPQTKY